MDFGDSKATADTIMERARKVAGGQTLAVSELAVEWLVTYGTIAQRTDQDRRHSTFRYPFEPSPPAAAFVGGLFDHRDRNLRRGLIGHSIMKAVQDQEAKYINAAGYLLEFNKSAIDLRQ